MKKYVFLLLAFLIPAIFCELSAENDNGKKEYNPEDTFKKDDNDKKEYNPENTFKKDDSNKKEYNPEDTFKQTKDESPNLEKKIKEFLKKDKEKAKALYTQAKTVAQLAKEAKKVKETRTAKLCGKIASGLEILAQFHDGKEISDKKLYKAYLDCRSLAEDIKQSKLRVAAAKRNTPQAIKIRKFQRSAKNYLRKAKKASKKSRKAEAEYYTTCAKIKQKAAVSYAGNPGIEAISKKQIKQARSKYNQQSAKESASLFRRRAAEQRKQENSAKAAYYEKVATLKDKLAAAYASSNKKLVKSIKTEYAKLQAEKL